MRLSLRSSNMIEWLALRAGLVPAPAAEAWAGMALSGVLIAATRLGLTERLAAAPATVDELATDLDLDPVAVRLLLDCLRSAGHVACHEDRDQQARYQLSRRSRRWLDPASDLSVARFIACNADYWAWWSDLSEVARARTPFGHHDAAPDDPYWRRSVTGQFELARLSAAEVAAKLRLPRDARSVLDVGGGHGWYSAELCQRHPRLAATVLDLPGSARIGREIIARAGLADRVRHCEGDALTEDWGEDVAGGYDLVLCFNLIHHLDPAQVVGLLARLRGVLAPGGCLAVMDAFAVPQRRSSAAANFLGMFVYLSSGAQAYTPAQLHEWLDAAGFAQPRKLPIRRIPGQALYQTTSRS